MLRPPQHFWGGPVRLGKSAACGLSKSKNHGLHHLLIYGHAICSSFSVLTIQEFVQYRAVFLKWLRGRITIYWSAVSAMLLPANM